MKFSTLAFLSLLASATAWAMGLERRQPSGGHSDAPTQNAGICSGPPPQLLTGGDVFDSSEWQEWHCLTVQNWFKHVPTCTQQCSNLAYNNDGCAYDDFVCHCSHTQKFVDILEPCILPTSLGGRGVGDCTLAEHSISEGVVKDLCTFLNATGYADFAGCPASLTLELTNELLKFDNETA